MQPMQSPMQVQSRNTASFLRHYVSLFRVLHARMA